MTILSRQRAALSTGLEYDFCDSFLGEYLVARTPRGICHLSFTDGNRPASLELLASRWPGMSLEPRFLGELQVWDLRATESSRLNLDLRGTAFQREVWAALLDLSPGETLSYGDLASRLGRPKAARAVASAVGSNCIAVLVPCHRIVAAGGGLGGYRWGLERKAALLQRESLRAA